MGRRSATETITNFLVAFLREPTWKQKDLERYCGVGTRTIRQCLLDLQAAGVPLDLAVLESAAQRKVPVRMGYYSASRAEHGIRVVSVQRISYGERTRFVAHCHASSRLKWFRADRVTGRASTRPQPTRRSIGPRSIASSPTASTVTAEEATR